MGIYSVNTGANVAPRPLDGISLANTLIVGQSNAAAHAESNYLASLGGEWDGSTMSTSTGMKNAIGAAFVKLANLAPESRTGPIGFRWSRSAFGGQELDEFTPGGDFYSHMQVREAWLNDEFGQIDLNIMLIGETDAGLSKTYAQQETSFLNYLAGLDTPPKAVVVIGPLDMFDVPNSQENVIRSVYSDQADASLVDRVENDPRPVIVYCDVSSVPDDHLVEPNGNHHWVLDATIDAAAELIAASLLELF